MKLVPFGSIDWTAWDQVVDRSDEAWLMHRAPWIAIEERFFVQKNVSFALVDNGDILGIHPLYLSNTGVAYGERLLHSGIHRHAGLALVAALDKKLVSMARSMAMEFIFDIAEREAIDRIQLSTHNLAPINRTHRREEIPFWVTEYGFHLGLRFQDGGFAPCPGMTTCCADQIVDLRVTEEVMFDRLQPSCRRAIRKACKYGLTFEMTRDRVKFDDYLALAQRSSLRTGDVLTPIEYYSAILDAFGDSGRAAIGFVLFEKRPIAALFVIFDKRAASFLAGVSEPATLHTRCNDFIHWQFMVWAKRQGYEAYRLGPWFPEVPRSWPISRISYFKKKFGGKATTIIQGSLFRNADLYLDQALNAHDRNRGIGRGSFKSVLDESR